MNDFYKLDENKNAVPCSGDEWGDQIQEMMRTRTKHVNQETVGDYWISTVWLGLNRGYDANRPLIFETRIIHKSTKWLDYQVRYSTWQEAEEGHKQAVQWVKDGCN